MKQHILPVELAVRYGMEEALLLQGLADYMSGLKTGEQCVLREGRLWLMVSMRQLQAEFPYMSTYLLRRTLDSLTWEKLLEQTELEPGQLRRRRVSGYSLTNKAMELLNST